MKGAFKLRPKSGEFSSPQLPTAAAANESLAKSVMDKAASLKGTFKRKKDRNSMSLMNSVRKRTDIHFMLSFSYVECILLKIVWCEEVLMC